MARYEIFYTLCPIHPSIDRLWERRKKEDLTYRFSVNGCDTGEQKSTSKDEFCGKLRNDQLNNFCAKDLREKEFAARSCG